ncbi:MAG TPA: response regulator, partial [Blastocatellia bacterium]|nr:response regulator [Blastocatellia bacterium]
METNSQNLIPSGIEPVDKLLGGLERGQLYIVHGDAAGKSLFGIKFLIEGLKQGEHGALVIRYSPEDSVRRFARLGYDCLEDIYSGRLVILEYSDDITQQISRLTEITPVLRELEWLFGETKPQRIIFDPVANLVKGEQQPLEPRAKEFADWAKTFGATVVMVANGENEEVVEKFMPLVAESFRFGVRETADRATRFFSFEKSASIADQAIEVDPSRGVFLLGRLQPEPSATFFHVVSPTTAERGTIQIEPEPQPVAQAEQLSLASAVELEELTEALLRETEKYNEKTVPPPAEELELPALEAEHEPEQEPELEQQAESEPRTVRDTTPLAPSVEAAQLLLPADHGDGGEGKGVEDKSDEAAPIVDQSTDLFEGQTDDLLSNLLGEITDPDSPLDLDIFETPAVAAAPETLEPAPVAEPEPVHETAVDQPAASTDFAILEAESAGAEIVEAETVEAEIVEAEGVAPDESAKAEVEQPESVELATEEVTSLEPATEPALAEAIDERYDLELTASPEPVSESAEEEPAAASEESAEPEDAEPEEAEQPVAQALDTKVTARAVEILLRPPDSKTEIPLSVPSFASSVTEETALAPVRTKDFNVLVIDDDFAACEVIAHALDEYTLEIMHDGVSGLAKLISFKPDIVILDVDLPIVDGFKVLAHIRSSLNMPVIVVSKSRVRASDRVLAAELGADYYMTKPFSIKELRHKVRQLIARYRGISSWIVTSSSATEAATEKPAPQPFEPARQEHVAGQEAGRQVANASDQFMPYPDFVSHVEGRVRAAIDNGSSFSIAGCRLSNMTSNGGRAAIKLYEMICSVVRDTDLVSTNPRNDLVVLLADADASGARAFVGRLRDRVLNEMSQEPSVWIRSFPDLEETAESYPQTETMESLHPYRRASDRQNQG